ncbi:unnamed protein product [Rotaria socialis]
MSTQTEANAPMVLLESITKNVYRIGGPILIMLGTISCLLSYIIFQQKNLHKNPSTIYVFSFNWCNLLFIYTTLLATTLDTGYNIHATAID